MKTNLTPWFDGKEHKPARPGVYQLMCGMGREIGYQLWDGRHWHDWHRSPNGAAEFSPIVGPSYQNDDWRGLAQEAPKPPRVADGG